MARSDNWQERFWSKVIKTDNCWEWNGACNAHGYGVFELFGAYPLAHRVAYELLVKPIPNGMQLDHLCRNHGCVNPVHLEIVPSGENTKRGRDSRGKPTHCPSGHPYTPENTMIDSKGHQHCKICHRASSRRSYYGKK